ncbi:RiPP maturation radical SAM C-methyltransferase [Paenibacillus glufosinatiresistens]|uniref:RiPP maturation radical SAM C-methyltransferase n=1 Tax=Paenibacillus glufosinatiresistens TaxID=3070657 RepID=UPI00286E2C81|nr:RiPP maturation radical SAM C-methyltransferase [Paenibacillus sp. YX.27]
MRVLFVNMPFASAYRPSIGISLLQAGLLKHGIACESCYLNLTFARMIGQATYDHLAENFTYATNSLAGEWIFSESLFGVDNFKEYTDYYAAAFPSGTETPEQRRELFERLSCIRSEVEAFLDGALRERDWASYDVIGFTSVFQQNVAALSLAKRLKERFPDKIIAFGGANMDGVMGPGTLQAYPFIDVVCSGEGDDSFIEFMKQLESGRSLTECSVQGVLLNPRYGAPGPSAPASSQPVHDMNSLPYPNYDDYFQQYLEAGLEPSAEKQSFLFESSRGCWWGQKSHCLFCGLNGSTMNYRSKSPKRALDEIIYLKERYQNFTNRATAVDNIIDMGYFKSLLPEIRDRNLNLNMFYETKANLTKEQIQLFRDAGFYYVQPGIESLITSVLRRMKKGVSMLQNVRLLKWCAEYGVGPMWNFLYGFPGENPEDYEEAASLIPSLVHLAPPAGTSPIRLDRFSPYFDSPHEYRIRNIRPLQAYEYVYPALPPEQRAGIACHFDFDYGDGQQPSSYIRNLAEAIRSWKTDYSTSELFSVLKENQLALVDTRPVAARTITLLSIHETAVYLECDNMSSSDNVAARLRTRGFGISSEEVRDILCSFVARRLMLTEEGVFLSLAIPLGDYSPKRAGLERLREMQEAAQST